MNGRLPQPVTPWQRPVAPLHFRSIYAPPRTGQEPPPTPTEVRQDERFIDRLRSGLNAVTPALLFTAIGTGFALAVGSGLGSAFMAYILPERRRRR